MNPGALAPVALVLLCPVAMLLLMRFAMTGGGQADTPSAQLTPAERLARLERQHFELGTAIAAEKATSERALLADPSQAR